MESPKPKSHIDVRRNPEDTTYVIGVHLEDGAYAAFSLFDSDDDATLPGKFLAMSKRIEPTPPTKEQLAAGRRRRR